MTVVFLFSYSKKGNFKMVKSNTCTAQIVEHNQINIRTITLTHLNLPVVTHLIRSLIILSLENSSALHINRTFVLREHIYK